MPQVASVSQVELRAQLRAQLRERQSSSVSRPEAKVLPFPVASASEDSAWQSVGQAASNVLRHLRPMPSSQK